MDPRDPIFQFGSFDPQIEIAEPKLKKFFLRKAQPRRLRPLAFGARLVRCDIGRAIRRHCALLRFFRNQDVTSLLSDILAGERFGRKRLTCRAPGQLIP